MSIDSYVVYDSVTGNIKSILHGSPIDALDIPNGSWFLTGDADISTQKVNIDSANPAEHYIEFKPQPVTPVTISQLKEIRDRLELSPIIVDAVPYDIDDKSLKRMAGAIANWNDLTQTVTSGEISWIAADGSTVLLTKVELEGVKADIDLELAKRTDRLFLFFSAKVAVIGTLVQADVADANWPVDS